MELLLVTITVTVTPQNGYDFSSGGDGDINWLSNWRNREAAVGHSGHSPLGYASLTEPRPDNLHISFRLVGVGQVEGRYELGSKECLQKFCTYVVNCYQI